METSLNVYDYPDPPEEKETELEIYVTIRATDIFPEGWDNLEIEDHIKANLRDYVIDGEVEVDEVRVWR